MDNHRLVFFRELSPRAQSRRRPWLRGIRTLFPAFPAPLMNRRRFLRCCFPVTEHPVSSLADSRMNLRIVVFLRSALCELSEFSIRSRVILFYSFFYHYYAIILRQSIYLLSEKKETKCEKLWIFSIWIFFRNLCLKCFLVYILWLVIIGYSLANLILETRMIFL